MVRPLVCGFLFAVAAGLISWTVATEPLPLVLIPLYAGLFVLAVGLSGWQFRKVVRSWFVIITTNQQQ